MAKNMAEEIFGAERQAEKIISDADNNAFQLEDRAKQQAKVEKEKITDEARAFADELIKKAYAESESLKNEAVKESEKDIESLNLAFEKNLNAAAQAAIGIIVK